MSECASSSEQRPEPRFKVRLAIFYGLKHQKLMTDYAVNMSTGGIFIETENILPVGTPLFVEFMLPNNDMLITCKARVAWTNEPDVLKSSVHPPGMGLQFLNLSLENIHAIRNFFDKGGLAPVW